MVPGSSSVPVRLRADPSRRRSPPGHWLRLLALFVVALCAGSACTDSDRAPPGAGSDDGKTPTSVSNDRCATPDTGCPCDDPGKLVECGQVTLRSGDYVTCSQGTRLCTSENVWGDCYGDHETVKFVPEGDRQTLQLGMPQSCSNPCSPECQTVTDVGSDLDDLTGNLCTVGGGLGVCPGCGYIGPHGGTGYDGLPNAWQRLPAACDSDTDCSYDTRCIDDTCQRWSYPCFDAAAENCALADFVLGPPCLNGATYHVQLCNRGSRRVDSGVMRIGVYADSAAIGTCTDATLAAPDAGQITFNFGTNPGRYLEPGQCVDVNPQNSTATGLSLGTVRAVVANYDGSASECNYCNNWNVLDPAPGCTGCVGRECSQICPASTLTGRVFDPRGVNPLPGVTVYVPRDELAAFPNGVGCDTCANLYSGYPLTSAVTGPDGSFTLTNMPSNVDYEVVIQTGRWRRRVPGPRIAPCATETLGVDANGVPLGRLPRSQTRCSGPNCVGEGDIPLMALVMSDADPLQCLFRKIGIDEAELSAPSGNGRIHLYNDNGMEKPGSPAAYSLFGGGSLFNDAQQLDRYNAVFAPCDFRHNTFDRRQPGEPIRTREGPAYNNHPDPTATPAEQANVLRYVDRGGRLFATHWMSLDFVYTNWNRPQLSPFVTPAMLITPVAGWTTQPPAVPFNAAAPIRHLFGDNVNRAGNAQGAGPAWNYTIDTATPLGQTFSAWAQGVGASPAGPGTITFTHWAQFMDQVRSPAIRLAHTPTAPDARRQSCIGESCDGRFWGTPHSAMAQFDTPFTAPAAQQCGRVVVAQSHVAEHSPCQLRSTDGCTPGLTPPDCACLDLPADGVPPADRETGWAAACGDEAAPLTAQEKAFEFLVFSTTQCIGAVAPPPPSVSLEPAEFVRDYEGVCDEGEEPVWRHFSWRTVIPTGTSISFTARTADQREDLDMSAPVNVGVSDVSAMTFTSLPETVDQRLRAATPAQASRRWLRVTVRLQPNGTVSPTLTEWRQLFDCVATQ